MESPEKANMRAAQEHNTAEKHIHQRVNAIHLIAEAFECTTEDVEIMLSLLRVHGVYEIIDAIEDFREGTSLTWSFGTIVIAAKNVTLKYLYGKIDDELHTRLSKVAVSTQPTIYGTSLNDEGLNEKTLMVFTDMIKYGVRIERINEMVKAHGANEV